MAEEYKLDGATRKVSIADRIHFGMMSLVHETLYGLVQDPYQALDAAGLEPGQRVLEVGCGPGFFTVPAARMVGEGGYLCTLDISPLALKKVQGKMDEAGVSNVEMMLADAAQTGLPDGSFDLVFVFGFAHPVGEMEGILVELHRLLKPGGVLAVEGRVEPSSALFEPTGRQGRISRFRKR